MADAIEVGAQGLVLFALAGRFRELDRAEVRALLARHGQDLLAAAQERDPRESVAGGLRRGLDGARLRAFGQHDVPLRRACALVNALDRVHGNCERYHRHRARPFRRSWPM
jgi:hypothetical protein